VAIKKGGAQGGRKCFIGLGRNRVAILVPNVHLTYHGWLYQNHPFHPLPPALKTRSFTPHELGVGLYGVFGAIRTKLGDYLSNCEKVEL
jgi:hypothetical protein